MASFLSFSTAEGLRPLMGEFCLVVNVKSNMVDKSCGVGNVIGVLRNICSASNYNVGIWRTIELVRSGYGGNSSKLVY